MYSEDDEQLRVSAVTSRYYSRQPRCTVKMTSNSATVYSEDDEQLRVSAVTSRYYSRQPRCTVKMTSNSESVLSPVGIIAGSHGVQ